jgi:salicylate hydroxylase
VTSTTSDGTDVLVAGAGIGGLTTALACARRGFRVRVLERSPTISEVGAGLQLSPNAARVLRALGLGEALESVAVRPEAVEIRHWRTGRRVDRAPLGATAEARYGAPYYHVHRADLQQLLVHALADLPGVELRTGAAVEAVDRHPEGATAHTAAGPFRGRVLIGADGIHSRVREALFGPDAPRFTRQVAWRVLVAAEHAGTLPPVAAVWWGPQRHFVAYRVRGGALVNCVGVVERDDWTRESWTEPGDPTEFAADFRGWDGPVQELVAAAEPGTCFRWALFDRRPLPRWHRGPVTLLGDACHPTLPFLAQGAAMAIEDAAVLARCLDRNGLAEHALARYESLRRPRTARIQAGSRRNARVFHLAGPAAWLRDRVAARAGSGMMDWLYRYDALAAGEPSPAAPHTEDPR